jgi:hypothetical protein
MYAPVIGVPAGGLRKKRSRLNLERETRKERWNWTVSFLPEAAKESVDDF